jgi:serine/threonine protein kinase
MDTDSDPRLPRMHGAQLLLQNLPDLSKLQRIHSGSRHRLYRCRRVDAAAVIKLDAAEPTSGSAGASVRHEFELLRDLELSGIVRVLGLVDTGAGLALAMEDAGDSNLAQRIQPGPLSMATFLAAAVQLAEAVSGLHEARIIHRDIHPGNVVWNSETGTATLCDFAIARTSPTLVIDSPNPNSSRELSLACRRSRPVAPVGPWIGERISTRSAPPFTRC